MLLSEEVIGRDAATRRIRRKAAGFPTGKTLASWRAEESSIPEATQNALQTLEWVCCTTPTWCSPMATATGSPRPWPARGDALT